MHAISLNNCIFCGQEGCVPKNESYVPKKSSNLIAVFTVLFKRMQEMQWQSELNTDDLSSLFEVNKFFHGKSQITWQGMLLNFSQSKLLTLSIKELSATQAQTVYSQIKKLINRVPKEGQPGKFRNSAEPLKKLDVENETSGLVFQAISNDHPDLLKLLFASGANMEQESQGSDFTYKPGAGRRSAYTPLYTALDDAGTLDCVEVILNAGAALDTVRDSAFSLQNQNDAYYEPRNTKAFAILARELKARGLIDDSFAVNVRNLLFVCMKNYEELGNFEDLVKIALGAGADINAKNSNGFTALMLAVEKAYEHKRYKNIIRLLLGAGADVNIKHDKTGETALQLAQNNMKRFANNKTREQFYGEIAQMLTSAGENNIAAH